MVRLCIQTSSCKRDSQHRMLCRLFQGRPYQNHRGSTTCSGIRRSRLVLMLRLYQVQSMPLRLLVQPQLRCWSFEHIQQECQKLNHQVQF